MKHLLTSSILMSCLLVTGTAYAQDALFKIEGEAERLRGDKMRTQQVPIELNREALKSGERGELIFNLPEEELLLRIEPMDPKGFNLKNGQSVWQGLSEKGAQGIFIRDGNLFRGQVMYNGRVYIVKPSREGWVLEIIDQSRFEDHPPRESFQPQNFQPDEQGDSSCLDTPDIIDVMVMYTPAARAGAGSKTLMEFEVAMAVASANVALTNSSAAHRFNLVHTDEVTYTEAVGGVDSNTFLSQVRNQTDMVVDGIHALRDTHKADLVTVIYEVDDGNWCGWGNTVVSPDSDTTDDRAFSVVARGCATGNLSYAHELGHNFGNYHDRANAGTTTVANYNFGHIEPTPASSTAPWRTVMSYNNPCSTQAGGTTCTRQAYYSNPNVQYLGDDTGVALTATEPEHNVQMMADGDAEVAKYRCRNSNLTTFAWARDTWDDTGAEPDPATVGQSMWRSPYIWVRNTQDTAGTQEHVHQDPENGQTNFAYVKLHNDGNSNDSGVVETYVAPASTSLNNSANWSLVGSQTVAALTPGTEVFEFSWAIPSTDSGHYCMLARWNNNATPLSFTNVNTAVRNSNDLIWRNLNIVDLQGDPEGDLAMSFNFAKADRFEETFLVFNHVNRSVFDVPWRRLSTVQITFDPKHVHVDDLKAIGAERVNENTFEFQLSEKPTLFGPFKNADKVGQSAKLVFQPSSRRVKRFQQKQNTATVSELSVTEYDMKVFEMVAKGAEGAMKEAREHRVGGITYQVMLPDPNAPRMTEFKERDKDERLRRRR